MKNKHIVYLTENTINKKLYVGIHSGNNKYYLGSGIALKSALAKHGIENFTKQILFECESRDEAFWIESLIVNQYVIDSDQFYNLALGGLGSSGICNKGKSHNEYIQQLKKINPNIIPLEKYKGANKKIKHKCLIHKYVWKVVPSSLIQGQGCPKCGIEKLKFSKSFTNEEYLQRLKEINKNTIIPIETYINSNTKIKHQCLICNYIWKVQPNSLINLNTGCPKCSGCYRRSHEEYCRDLKKVNPTIEPLEKYIKSKVKIKHRCLKCKHTWNISPDKLLGGRGCPKCVISGKREKFSKAVVAIDDDNFLIFKSLTDARLVLNVDNISACLKGKLKHSKGYKFRFA